MILAICEVVLGDPLATEFTVPCCTVGSEVLGLEGQVSRCQATLGDVRLVTGNRREALQGDYFEVSGEQRVCATMCGRVLHARFVTCTLWRPGVVLEMNNQGPALVYPDPATADKTCVGYVYHNGVYFARLSYDNSLVHFSNYESARVRLWTPLPGMGLFQYSRVLGGWLESDGEEPVEYGGSKRLRFDPCVNVRFLAIMYEISQ